MGVDMVILWLKRLLCQHPFVVNVQRTEGRGWIHCVQCVRCGKEW